MSGIFYSKRPLYKVLTKEEIIIAPFVVKKGEVFYRSNSIYQKEPFEGVISETQMLIAKYSQLKDNSVEVYVINMVKKIKQYDQNG